MDRDTMIAELDEALEWLVQEFESMIVMHATAALARLRAGLAGEGESVGVVVEGLATMFDRMAMTDPNERYPSRDVAKMIRDFRPAPSLPAGGAEAAVLREREECAKLMDEEADAAARNNDQDGMEAACRGAAAIRARPAPSPLPPGPGAVPPKEPAEGPFCPCCGRALSCYCHEHPHPENPKCPGNAPPADPAAVPGEAATAGKTPEERADEVWRKINKPGIENPYHRPWLIAEAIRAAVADALAEPVALLRAARDATQHTADPYAFTTGQKFKPGHHCRPDCVRCKIEAWLKKGPQQ